MNIQDIEKEFDEKFSYLIYTNDFQDLEKINDIKAFLTQKLREAMESVNPGRIRFEASPKITISDGYNKAIADIDRNITNFFKEL